MSNPQSTPRVAHAGTERNAHGDDKWIEDLAAVLMRLLGVYFAASAMSSVFAECNLLISVWNKFGMRYGFFLWTIASSARVVVEFLIGIYLALGGQWVFDRLLTPVACRRSNSPIADMNEDATSNPQQSKEERDASIE